MNRMISEKIAALEPSATEELENTVKRMERDGCSDIISLGVGEPPFDTPANIKEAAWRALLSGKTKYGPTAGDYELREAICAKLIKENRIKTSEDNVMITPGGKFGIYLAFQAVLQEGDKVMILDPSWVTYAPAAKMAGASVVRIPSTPEAGFQPDIEAIKMAMDNSVKIIVINSPNNPTGAVFEETTIREIIALAQKYGSWILSDEIYEYLIYEGKHYSPASEFENVITINGFSKSHAMTGWRLGYVVAPTEIMEGMKKIFQHSISCVAAFAQAGALEALKSEISRKATKSMIEEYKERRAVMLEHIQRSEIFDIKKPTGGAFYLFPSFRFQKPSIEFAKELLERVHVATVPGSAFGKCGEGHLRLCYTATKDNIIEALQRIESFLK